MTQAIMIAFEGIDGSGKSTVIEHLADLVRAHHQSVLVVQEPGTTAVGKQIRAILKSPDPCTALASTLLYEASRANNVAHALRPSLTRYDYILLDRYTDSTLAYQSWGGGLKRETVEQLNEIATDGLKPNLRYLIDVDLPTAAARRKLRKNTPDSRDEFDTRIDYAKRVYQGYQQLVKEGQLTALTNQNSAETAERIWRRIQA